MKKIISLLIILFESFSLMAQDATFTLIDHNPVSINPAFCIAPGNQIQAMTLSRQQWWNLPGASAYSAAYHMNNGTVLLPITSERYEATGFALQAFSNSSGEGDFTYSGITGTVGFKKVVPLRNRSILSYQGGWGLSARNFSIDWSKLTFSSQLDPFYGYISSIPIINPRVNNSPDYFTITNNVGFNVEYLPSNRMWKLSAGGGCFNLSNLSGYTFFGDDEAVLPRKFSSNVSFISFSNGKSGLVEDLKSSYFVVRHNFEYQSSLMNNETRIGTNIAGAVTVFAGYRRRDLFTQNAVDGSLNQDALLYSLQINTPNFIASIGYDFTVSGLNIARTRGTTEFGLIVPLGTRGNIKGRRASEPCYVDYLMSHSEWKAVEQFNKKSTSWGRQYSPVTFIR